MKISFKINILLLLFLTVNCDNNNPCGDGVLASTGPPFFELKIANKTTGENLISNGTYAANQIAITDINGNRIEYFFRYQNERNTFIVYPQKNLQDIGVRKVFFKIENLVTIELEVNIYEGKSECFTNYFARDYKALNYPYEISTEGLLIVKL